MHVCEKISQLLNLVKEAHNKYTQISGTLRRQLPSTQTLYSGSQCDELSVPVRLGILVSTRFGSSFRAAEQRTFFPLVILGSRE